MSSPTFSFHENMGILEPFLCNKKGYLRVRQPFLFFIYFCIGRMSTRIARATTRRR